MRKWLLVYKGQFGKTLKGPEIRYIRLGEQFVAAGDKVAIAGLSASEDSLPDGVDFVSVRSKPGLIKAMLAADTIVLHGGGGWILLLSLLAAFLGKRVILDAYAPHWIEIHSSIQRTASSGKALVKVLVNLARTVMGVLCFDGVVVANQRQQDLLRGMGSALGRLDSFKRIRVVEFGAEKFETRTRSKDWFKAHAGDVSDNEFLIGWLGGFWDWFDPEPVLSAMASVSKADQEIRFVFFGLDEKRRKEFRELLAGYGGRESSLIFLPWVPFKERLAIWSGLDAAIVWGGRSYENDYASRTRNFDCISIGLPVIQNWDDQWGRILMDNDCGVVGTMASLAEDILALKRDPLRCRRMEENMRSLIDFYGWPRVAQRFENVAELPLQPRYMKLAGLICFAILLPLVMAGYLLGKRQHEAGG